MSLPRIEARQQVHIERTECAGMLISACAERDFTIEISAEATTPGGALRALEEGIKRECTLQQLRVGAVGEAKVCEPQGQPKITTLPSRNKVGQFFYKLREALNAPPW